MLALNTIGNTYSYVNDHEHGIECYRQSAQIAAEVGDPNLEALVLGNLGASFIQSNQPQAAEPLLRKALAIARDLGDTQQFANALENFAWWQIATHHDEDARALLLESLTHYRSVGVPPTQQLVLFAVLEARAGRRERALEFLGAARATEGWQSAQVALYERIHLAELRGDLSDAQVHAAFERGAAKGVEHLFEGITSGTLDRDAETEPA
jgi:tetratricopeptide (TPR) repeat protein